MIRMRIRRIDLRSLARHGCLLGVALAMLPSLACGVGIVWASHAVGRWVERWQVLPIQLFGQEIARIDLVQTLGLEPFAEVLRTISAATPIVMLASVAWLAVAVGLLLASAALLLGLAYNVLASVSGGIVVEAEAHSVRARSTRE